MDMLRDIMFFCVRILHFLRMIQFSVKCIGRCCILSAFTSVRNGKNFDQIQIKHQLKTKNYISVWAASFFMKLEKYGKWTIGHTYFSHHL